MTFGAKQGGGLVVDRQEPLRLTGRLEAAHDLFSPPRVPVRSLGAIVEPFVLAVLDTKSPVCLRGAVRAQLVRDEHARLTPGFEQLSEIAHRGRLVSAGLDQDVQNVTVGVNRSPEPVFAPLDRHHDLVEMPFIGRSRRTFAANWAPKRATQSRTVS